jgi:hypothetical protein
VTAAAAGRPDSTAQPRQPVTIDALHAWLDQAAPGDSFTYFVGSYLVPGMAIVAAARAASDRGAVLLTQRRREDRLFDYLATKRRNAEPVAAPARRGVSRGPCGVADEEKEWLMAVLRRKASLSLPCPTNRQLAEEAQLKDAESVRYRLGLLQQEGRIAIQWIDADRRVITIVASGRSTAR